VTVAKGNKHYRLYAVDSENNSTKKILKISGITKKKPYREKPQYDSASSRPSLWVLTIGVSKYSNPNLNLKYADHDALSMEKIFKKLRKGIFSEVFTRTLVNEQATRGNILQAMSTHLGKAAPQDVVLIFVAGHGIKHTQTGSYYFLPHNADSRNLLFEGLKWSDFEEAIKIISKNVSKVILILDTCHSGAINIAMRGVRSGEDLGALMKEATGLYVLSASKGGEPSVEGNRFRLPGENKGHGAFTYSILKGLSGEANYDKNSYLTIGELFSFVSVQVPRITRGQQHPYSKIDGTDLPIVKFKK
ncbi:MAG: caspase family protein, partial [Deltaproteobacteria bacterium]|nr:caspase family protein [Deltaproteobacteria bacterium]